MAFYKRPEFLVLFVLLASVPIIGFSIYSSISFQIAEIVTTLTSHPCIFSHQSSEWDLKPLSRTSDQCSTSNPDACSDYHIHRDASDFYFNICSNAMRKPAECSSLYGDQGVFNSIGYQTADGECHYMGRLDTGKWSALR